MQVSVCVGLLRSFVCSIYWCMLQGKRGIEGKERRLKLTNHYNLVISCEE